MGFMGQRSYEERICCVCREEMGLGALPNRVRRSSTGPERGHGAHRPHHRPLPGDELSTETLVASSSLVPCARIEAHGGRGFIPPLLCIIR